MPLAKQGGFISCLLQKLGEGLLAPIEALVEVRHSVAVGVFPGQGGRPGRGTERVWSESMFKAHPFVGNPVEGRGLDIFVSITTQCLLGMVIGEDH